MTRHSPGLSVEECPVGTELLYPCGAQGNAERESGVISLSATVSLDEDELEFTAIRAQGSGGQNVNKAASAIHLRFDIRAASLPAVHKVRPLGWRDGRLPRAGSGG